MQGLVTNLMKLQKVVNVLGANVTDVYGMKEIQICRADAFSDKSVDSKLVEGKYQTTRSFFDGNVAIVSCGHVRRRKKDHIS